MKKEEILFNVVNDIAGVSKEEIIKENRLRRISDPRRMIAYILHRKIGYGLEHSGSIMNRDHSSVLYLCKSHELLIETSSDYKEKYNNIYAEWYYRVNHVKYELNVDEMFDKLMIDYDKIKKQLVTLKRKIDESR